jgi:hypothetical protein
VLHAQENAEYVGVERRGVAIFRLIGHDARLALGAGIVDGNVEPSEFCDSLVDEVADLFVAAHVGANEFSLSTERTEFGYESLADVVLPTGHNEACAFLRKSESSRATDAAQAACYQYYLVGHRVLSF